MACEQGLPGVHSGLPPEHHRERRVGEIDGVCVVWHLSLTQGPSDGDIINLVDQRNETVFVVVCVREARKNVNSHRGGSGCLESPLGLPECVH